eukprot:scaffold123743_cov57-Phaeocystis_antarctica.AAC.3
MCAQDGNQYPVLSTFPPMSSVHCTLAPDDTVPCTLPPRSPFTPNTTRTHAHEDIYRDKRALAVTPGELGGTRQYLLPQ